MRSAGAMMKAARRATSLRAFSTPDTSAATVKPFQSIPGNWKGMMPLISVAPIFLPYVVKEADGGGLLTEDFLKDQYDRYGGETGISQFGPSSEKCAIVYDEGYLQVFQKEGKYPSGILEGAWPIKQYNEKYAKESPPNPFLERGETWRKGRMAINPYLFNIQAAQSYLDPINETARSAAEHFEDFATTGRFDQFCELAAFDMFTAAALGVQLNSVGGDPKGLHYFKEIHGGIGTMVKVTTNCPYSKLDMFKFGAWDGFVSEWDRGRKAGTELVESVMEGKLGTGTGIMHGFLNDESLKISREEATEMYLILTFASADTTAGFINNALSNIAKHPSFKIKSEPSSRLNWVARITIRTMARMDNL